MSKQYRQGDVLLVPVREVPSDAAEVQLEQGRIVLAHGEATGHAHTVAGGDGASLLSAPDGRRYLRLSRPAQLVHQEHDAIDLPAGDYHVVRQREYSPEAIRNVAD